LIGAGGEIAIGDTLVFGAGIGDEMEGAAVGDLKGVGEAQLASNMTVMLITDKESFPTTLIRPFRRIHDKNAQRKGSISHGDAPLCNQLSSSEITELR
jgi:hypothetical protein